MTHDPALWPETLTETPAPADAVELNGRRLRQLESLGTYVVQHPVEPPPRHLRRRAWALVPRTVRATAPAATPSWLPARTRAYFAKQIRARNAVDRELAVSKGVSVGAPECARFQGPEYHDRLDAEVSRRRRAARKAAK